MIEGELIALGVDILLTYLFYELYKSNTQSANKLKKAPQCELNNELVQKLQGQESPHLAYACIEGTVHATSTPLQSHYRTEDQGVIHRIIKSEHRSKKSGGGFWADDVKTIIDHTYDVPMFIKNPEIAMSPEMLVISPLEANYLQESFYTTYDKFVPNESGALSKLIDRWWGDTVKGYQETEQMLKIGTHLLGVGEICLEDGKLKLKPPRVQGAKYILSTLGKNEIIKRLEKRGTIFKVITGLCSAVGLALLIFYLRKKYKQWLESQEYEEIRRARQTSTTTRQRDNGDDDGSAPDSQLCVVCLSNPRELVLLECGHICLCADCAEQLPRPRKCPVCRQTITRIIPTFIS
ncbi:mitochondrial ubiquitin ligase activator of nfkb 1-A [Lingula anatina]|uniref:RING-type E3 ubiquitin transferase n=1 Tax=Lingula anatina TaxID=7574 RepID=A0A1S3IR43_LINAN|nr:mitochondrial ubiquitin ligase activator of nfkb 1-A [Lingula anatina]|eukprot:XP_013400391.1 mitochondrial ubiquitin ligase activator of nfkb 1-A [Lingula anatina]